MKDLEAFIFYSLNLSTKESLRRKSSKGFKNKLTSKFYSLIQEEAFKIDNSKQTTFNEPDKNNIKESNPYENNDAFGKLLFNQPDEKIFNIDYNCYFNMSYDWNLNNSFNSIGNLNLHNSNLFQDEEDLYFKQYS